MIQIKIGKKRFKAVYRWDDMTLRQYCNLAAIAMPDGYEAYILADGKYNEEDQHAVEHYCNIVLALTDDQINRDFPAYYKKVCQCLSDVPEKYLTDDLVNSLYDWYFKPFVVSLLYHVPVISFMGQLKEYEPEPIKRFRIGFKRFYLPRVITIMGQEVPLADEPIISYSEACDIFRGMKVNRVDVQRLSLFMAIYCRGKKEAYNEAKVIERQQLFMNVPMSVVWNVFFYTARRLPEFMLNILLFGDLPKTLREIRSEVQTYRNMAVGDFYTNAPVTVD